jgi:hypothetical protein
MAGSLELLKAKEEFIGAYKAEKGKFEGDEFLKDFYDNAIRVMPSFEKVVWVRENGLPDANVDGLISKFVNEALGHHINLMYADDWFKIAIENLKPYINFKEHQERSKIGVPINVVGYDIYNQINELGKERWKEVDKGHPLFNQLKMLDDPFYLVLHIVNHLGKRLDQIFDKEEAREIFENLYKRHSDFAVRYVNRIINPDLVKDLIANDIFAFNRLRAIIDREYDYQASHYVRYYRTLRSQYKNKEEADKEILSRFLGAMHIDSIDELSAESIYRLGPVAFARLARFLAPGVLDPESAVKVRKKLGEIVNAIEKKIINDEKLSEAEEFVLNILISYNIIDVTRKPNLVKPKMTKETLESIFQKIINYSTSVDDALNRMNEQYKKYADKIKEFGVDVAKIFYEIPASKFGADWIIIPALKDHPILNIPEFKEAIRKALTSKKVQILVIRQLFQISQEEGGNLKMMTDKINSTYGINLPKVAKLNINEAIIKAATIIKNHKNLPSSTINQIELEFVAMDDDFKAAYASLAMDIGHKPIDAIASIQAKDETKMKRLALSILQLAINAGATQLARHAAKWVDPFENDEEKDELQKIVDPHGDPLEHLIKEWSNRFIPLIEIDDAKYFIDAATLKILKQKGDDPLLKPVLNRNEIKNILSKVDINKVNKLASAIQGIDLQLDRAQGFYNLVPLFKYTMPSNPKMERRIMFSPSDGQFYAFEVDKESGKIINEFPPSTSIPRYDFNTIENLHNIKQQIAERIKQAALKHFHRYKKESKLIIGDEPALVYADNNNIIYYLKGRLYKLDLSNLSQVQLDKGEMDKFKDYLYDIKPIEYERHQKRKEGYDLIDSVQIPGLRVTKFDIYKNPRTNELKAKYFNSDLDVPARLQDAIINKYLNLPELAKNNIFEIDGKKYIVTYDSKLKKYFIRDYDTKQYVPADQRKKILMQVAYKTKEYKLPDGRTIIIAYDPLKNSYFMFDKDTGDEIKNKNILKDYFMKDKKEVYYDNTRYIVYFDPIQNKYVVTYEDGREVQSERFKNKILKEMFTRKHSGDFYYVGQIEKIGDVYYHPFIKEFFIQKGNELIKADYVQHSLIMDYINENNIKLPNPPVDVKFSESVKKTKLAIREKIEEVVQGILSSINEREISNAFDHIIKQIVLSKTTKNIIKQEIIDFFRSDEKKINKKNIEDIVNFLIDRLNLKKYDLNYLGNLLMLELIHRNANKIYEILNSIINIIGHEINIDEETKTEMKKLNDYVKKLYSSFLNAVEPEKRNVYAKTLDELMPHLSGYHEISSQIWKPLALALLIEGLREKAYSFVGSVNFEQEIKKRVESIVQELIAKKIITIEE